MNYAANTFLLVGSSVQSKLLCLVHGQGQEREQKPTTKKLVGFHNDLSLSLIKCRCLHDQKKSCTWKMPESKLFSRGLHTNFGPGMGL